jgi:hypothetical protein
MSNIHGDLGTQEPTKGKLPQYTTQWRHRRHHISQGGKTKMADSQTESGSFAYEKLHGTYAETPTEKSNDMAAYLASTYTPNIFSIPRLHDSYCT